MPYLRQKIALFQWVNEVGAGFGQPLAQVVDRVDQAVQTPGIDAGLALEAAEQLGVPFELFDDVCANVATPENREDLQ